MVVVGAGVVLQQFLLMHSALFSAHLSQSQSEQSAVVLVVGLLLQQLFEEQRLLLASSAPV